MPTAILIASPRTPEAANNGRHASWYGFKRYCAPSCISARVYGGPPSLYTSSVRMSGGSARAVGLRRVYGGRRWQCGHWKQMLASLLQRYGRGSDGRLDEICGRRIFRVGNDGCDEDLLTDASGIPQRRPYVSAMKCLGLDRSFLQSRLAPDIPGTRRTSGLTGNRNLKESSCLKARRN